MERTIILRPGALGDVVVARGLLNFLQAVDPVQEIALAAPGGQGRLLASLSQLRDFLAWEAGEWAWLFSPSGLDQAPERLRRFAGDASLVLAFLGDGKEALQDWRLKLRALAPRAEIVLQPPQPLPESAVNIYDWLIQPARAYWEGRVSPESLALALSRSKEKYRVDPPKVTGLTGRYAVLHPGSGSRRKNWPYFDSLGQALSDLAAPEGGRFFSRVVVTAGEADQELGRRVAAAIPSALGVFSPSLEELAAILASSYLYVGNDSGVTHLAAAVRAAGGYPRLLTLFGPSDPRIWGAPGARILTAGDGMDRLGVAEVMTQVEEIIRDKG
ncbi:MAG: glycosyltransferase family 9 protein [Planctomycetota bacterium]|jgi:ADP-heptose:LPS heptosyltransferase|nr:glycosyltransferase family 9 protein [Planctomycetota bacterium]